MISVYFLIAPLFMLFIRFPVLYWSIIPLTVVSVLIHRAPMPHLDTVQLAIYFVSAYLAGMCTSQFRAKVNGVLSGRLGLLFLAYGIVLLLHYFLAPKHGVHAAATWFSTEQGVFDWPFVQKMTLCYLLLELGRKYHALLFPGLKYIADISFGIYFVHAYFLKSIAVLVPEVWLEGNLFSFAAVFGIVMLGCVASCYLMQRIFGKHSRMFVGC